MRADRRRLVVEACVCIRWCFVTVFLMTLAAVFMSGCSTGYILQASWEESKILLGREDIQELIDEGDVDEELAGKFALVLSARDFAKDLGLKPGGSFTEYSDIERDILIWVLTASKKTSFSPVTWWFPVVGRVPYKGFFSKEDGLDEARELSAEGFDFYLRPSPAFSTLGWFDDPLLSTLVKFDDVSLVNTVIHEILHNTLWISGHVAFNETLANAIGGLGAIEYFANVEGPDAANTRFARGVWHDELLWAEHIEKTYTTLQEFYKTETQENSDLNNAKTSELEFVEKRKEVFAQALERWKLVASQLQTPRYLKVSQSINNAVILSQKVYLDRLQLFMRLFDVCRQSLEDFIREVVDLSDNVSKLEADPFQMLEARIKDPQICQYRE